MAINFDPNFYQHNTMNSGGGSGGSGGGSSGGGGGNNAGNPLLTSPTAPYDPLAALYARMPQQMQFQPFMPGQQSAIANQLSQGFGAPAQDYMNQMNQVYRPMNLTQISEPLTQTMRSFGLQHSGKPGVVEAMDDGFNPQNYQQWGQSTGSPWLDAMFGLNPAQGVPGQGGTAAPVEDPKKKKNKTVTAGYTPGTGTYTPPTFQYPYGTLEARDASRYAGGLF